jgi:hypothetical protein
MDLRRWCLGLTLALFACCARAGIPYLNASPGWADTRDFGAKIDGVTDDTAAFTNAIWFLWTNRGGTVYSSAGTTLIRGKILLPYSNSTPWSMKPIRITGDGQDFNQYDAPRNGSIIWLDSNDPLGKIEGRGNGSLEIDHVSLIDLSNQSNSFVRLLATAGHIHDVTFRGGGPQIGVELGGTNIIWSGQPLTNSPFQGYITIIEACNFNSVTAAVQGGRYANSVIVQNNSVWKWAGGVAAFDFQLYSQGTVISGNLIEAMNYEYGIRLQGCSGFTIIGNAIWDSKTNTLAGIYLDSQSKSNTVFPGYTDSPAAKVIDLGQGNIIPGPNALSSGNGPPAGVPESREAIYIQLDSNPPRKIWTYANNSWQ